MRSRLIVESTPTLRPHATHGHFVPSPNSFASACLLAARCLLFGRSSPPARLELACFAAAASRAAANSAGDFSGMAWYFCTAMSLAALSSSSLAIPCSPRSFLPPTPICSPAPLATGVCSLSPLPPPAPPPPPPPDFPPPLPFG